LGTLSEAFALTTDPALRVERALILAATFAFAGLHENGALVLDEVLADIANGDPDVVLMVNAAWAAITLLIPSRVAEARRRLAALPSLEGATAAERLVVMQQLYIAASSNQPAGTIRMLADRVIGDWATPEQFPESGDWVWPRLFLGRIGDYDRVRELTDAGIAHAESTGSVVGMIAANFVRGLTEHDAGDLANAELHFGAMVAHRDGGLLIQMLGHAGLIKTFTRQGRLEEAQAVLSRFPDELPIGTPSTGAALVWDARASLAQAIGDHKGALAAAEGLHGLLADLDADSPTWVGWRRLAIEPLRSLGRIDEAHRLAHEHLDLCRKSEVPHLVGEALCTLATVTSDSDSAIELAREGVALIEPTDSRYRLGTAELTLGVLLRRAGRKAEARGHLGKAMEVLTECGATPGAEFAQAELAATGVRLTRSNPRLLTPSERRIAELVLSGLGNREIAARLHVTRKTVETHLSSVYRKLEISSRDQLAESHLS
ncbi:MAG TPA: LuxR C-terminal-related transcriptional regulator, partial [Marmoricola sp.]|nr:LuxR C-terminal-related transcriptional regulator [Marmoricola sp.]